MADPRGDVKRHPRDGTDRRATVKVPGGEEGGGSPPYEPPQLTDYGEVAKLTRGLIGGSGDGMMGLV